MIFKLIRPITTSLCVFCITTWKHFVSSLWMNATNFIFQLLHMDNLPTLVVLTPPHSPYKLFGDNTHLFVNYVNSSIDCTTFFTNYVKKYYDCANNSTDLANTHDKSSSNLYIPNPSLLLLLFIVLLVICRSKINIVLTIGSSICSSSSVLCICFYIS